MKNTRLYAPFIKQGRRWVRATRLDGTPFRAMRLNAASTYYQDWLLRSAMGEVPEVRELRPVITKKSS